MDGDEVVVGEGKGEEPFSVTVNVVLVDGTTMSCESAPPSDHEPNARELSKGSTAPIVLVMPTTAEKV